MIKTQYNYISMQAFSLESIGMDAKHHRSVYGHFLLGASFLVFAFLIANVFAPNVRTNADSQTIAETVGPYSISLANDSIAAMNITPTDTQTVYVIANNLTISNTCNAGAMITLKTTGTDNSLIRPTVNNDTLTKTIAATTGTSLQDNTWGFSINNGSTWSAVPASNETAATVYDSSTAASNVLIPVTFGVKVDNNLPAEAYTNDVVYTMTPKAGCLTYNVAWDFNGGVARAGITYPTVLDWGQLINLVDYIPTRDGYTFNGWIIDSVLYGASQGSTDINPNNNLDVTVKANWAPTCASGTTRINVNLSVNGVQDFDFINNSIRCAILQSEGYYRLEVWGGQGGLAHVSRDKVIYRGGYGGYSTGFYYSNGEALYIVVGGQASQSCATAGNSNCSGGYNGGAEGSRHCSTAGCSTWYSTIPSGGGGATHIATKSGLLSDLSDDQDSILIVASGGGGSSGYVTVTTDPYYHYGYGGNGGGYSGNNGTAGGNNLRNNCNGNGGAQNGGGAGCVTVNEGTLTNSGTFGQGGSLGGGGGWYGGGASYRGGSGGGSGYIGSTKLLSSSNVMKHMTCYSCTTNTTSVARTNSNTTNPTSTPVSDVARTGNGYARITYLGTSI